MALIHDLYRVSSNNFSYTYRGKTAVTSDTYTIDYTGEPSGVTYTGWRFGLVYTMTGSCTSVLTVNYSDGSKKTLTLTNGEWGELNNSVKPISFFIKTTGSRNSSSGRVTITDVISFEYYDYTISDTKSLIYNIANQNFDGVNDYIDTNIQLFRYQFNWVVFIDFTSDLTLSEMATVFHCMREEEPYPGTGIDSFYPNGRITCSSISGEDIELYDTPLAGNRHRVAIRKLGRNFHYVIPDNDIVDYTSYIDYVLIDNTAILGAFTDGEYGRFWGGTIHSCKIWSGYMSDEEFAALMVEPVNPVINILSQDKEIISDEEGHDTCTITFQSDKDLTYWEARATSSGSPGHGVGLLVESGGALAAGATGTVYVKERELTEGDLLYRIDIWGRDANGNWNEV